MLESGAEVPSVVGVVSTVEELFDVDCGGVLALIVEDSDVIFSVDWEAVDVAAPVVETEVGKFVEDIGVLLALSVFSDVDVVCLDDLVSAMVEDTEAELTLSVVVASVDVTPIVDVSAAVDLLGFGVADMVEASPVVSALDTDDVVDIIFVDETSGVEL